MRSLKTLERVWARLSRCRKRWVMYQPRYCTVAFITFDGQDCPDLMAC